MAEKEYRCHHSLNMCVFNRIRNKDQFFFSIWRTEEHTDVPTTSSSVINMVDVDAVIIWMGTSQIRNLQNMADVAEST